MPRGKAFLGTYGAGVVDSVLICGSSLPSASVGTLGDGFETFDGFCAIGSNALVGHPLPVLSSLPSHPLLGLR